MVSISGSKKLKRQMAPQFWGITRKDKTICRDSQDQAHIKKTTQYQLQSCLETH